MNTLNSIDPQDLTINELDSRVSQRTIFIQDLVREMFDKDCPRSSAITALQLNFKREELYDAARDLNRHVMQYSDHASVIVNTIFDAMERVQFVPVGQYDLERDYREAA